MTNLNLSGLTPVPPGKIATVVTYLEMRTPPPEMSAGRVLADVLVRRVTQADLAWYRDLFLRVGAEWLWSSRLKLDDAALAEILDDPDVELHALVLNGVDEGLIELDFREPQMCEIAFLGVTRRLIGSGAGRQMMRHAVTRAWSRPLERVWVHTCTFDHPAALPLYRRTGFRPFAQAIEIDDDPRLNGLLPRTAAPQVPLIG